MADKEVNKLGRQCIAFDCSNREGQGEPFHRFPADSNRIKRWISGIKRGKLYLHSKLCISCMVSRLKLVDALLVHFSFTLRQLITHGLFLEREFATLWHVTLNIFKSDRSRTGVSQVILKSSRYVYLLVNKAAGDDETMMLYAWSVEVGKARKKRANSAVPSFNNGLNSY